MTDLCGCGGDAKLARKPGSSQTACMMMMLGWHVREKQCITPMIQSEMYSVKGSAVHHQTTSSHSNLCSISSHIYPSVKLERERETDRFGNNMIALHDYYWR